LKYVVKLFHTPQPGNVESEATKKSANNIFFDVFAILKALLLPILQCGYE